MSNTTQTLKVKPSTDERIIYERIGEVEWKFRETKLDVHDQIALWPDNPRIRSVVDTIAPQEEIEAYLQREGGYDRLRKSLQEIGQRQSIYVQETDSGKYLVLEGNSRVTALRELDRKITTGDKEGKFRYVSAKIVPEEFGEREIVILLAGIHVQGSGVREWKAYVQAQFIYETVVGVPGKPQIMNQAELARSVGRSPGWVNKHKNTYEFALKFIEYLGGGPDAEMKAIDKFNALEEINRLKEIGPNLRDYENSKYDGLREEVFRMVENDAFKEGRDARYLKDFYENSELWEQLKSGEHHIAHKLSKQIGVRNSSPKAKIAELPRLLERAIKRDEGNFDEDDVIPLQEAIEIIHNQIHEGVPLYPVAIKRVVQTFNEASRANVRDISDADIEELNAAYQYFTGVVESHRNVHDKERAA